MHRKVALNTLVQSFGLLANFADRVLVVGLLVRAWGMEAFASWSAILAVTTMLSAAELSLNVHFGNRWQKLHAEGKSEEFRRLVGVSLTAYLVLCIVLAVGVGVVVALTRGCLVDLLKAGAFGGPETSAGFALLGLAQIFQISASSVSQVFRGRGDFALGQSMDVAINLLIASAACAAVLFGAGFIGLALTYLAMQSLVRWTITLTVLRRAYPDLRPAFKRPRRSDFVDIVGALRWLAVIQVSAVLLTQAPIVLLVQLGAPPAAVVGFITARTLFGLARTFSQFSAIGFAVEIASGVHAFGWAAAWPIIQKGAQFMQVMIGVGTGGLLAFSAPLMRLWTGTPTIHDPAIFAGLSVPLALVGGLYILHNSMMFTDELRRFALLWAWLLVSSLAAAALGFRLQGVAGFVAGLAIAEVAAFSLVLPLLARRLVPVAATWRLRTALIGAAVGGTSYACGQASLELLGSEGARLAASAALWAFGSAAPVLFAATPRTMKVAIFGQLRSVFT